MLHDLMQEEVLCAGYALAHLGFFYMHEIS
jgi:hypothetical protein